MEVLLCGSCGTAVVDPAAMAQRHGKPRLRLSSSLLCRDRRALRESCPACLRAYERLTLSWDDRWVELEECAECGYLLLGPGEIATLGALIEGVGADSPAPFEAPADWGEGEAFAKALRGIDWLLGSA